jgi:ketosteroid isomerase-like protein
MSAEIPVVLTALQAAMNTHDLAALTACFAADYRNETPAHPGRNFEGRAQVRQNWATILAATPDLRADLLRWARSTTDPATVWAEWAWTGTRPDGIPVHMAGVTVVGTGGEPADPVIRWARFYMEPVEQGSGNADGVRRAVGSAPAEQPAGAR